MEKQNIINYKKICEYAEKIKKLTPYIKNKEILEWVNEDMKEMNEIQQRLQYIRKVTRSIQSKKSKQNKDCNYR